MVFFDRSFLALRFWLVKLGLAVLLALGCSRLLELQDLLSPAFTALLCIRGTFYTGLHVAMTQLAAVVAGTGLSLGCTAVLGANDLSIAVSVMLAAFVCLKLHWESSTLLVLFTLLFTHLTPLGSLAQTAEIRILAVLMGVGVATLINYLFSYFRYRRMYYFRLRHALEQFESTLGSVRAAVARGDRAQLGCLVREIKSHARLVSMLYEESVDLRRESAVKRPGDLDEDLIPRIELLAGYLESSCWHLHGVIDSAIDLMTEGSSVPPAVREQLEAVAEMARESVAAIRDGHANFGELDAAAGTLKLPLFGMRLPELTLRAELILLTADLLQVRLHAQRFASELGDLGLYVESQPASARR